MEYPEYYPAQPYTVITDAPADQESGHEFVLHFDVEEERYYVFFFASERHAIGIRDEYERISGIRAIITQFDPYHIDERFGVRYIDTQGRHKDMTILEYRRNIEFKNEFRRED